MRVGLIALAVAALYSVGDFADGVSQPIEEVDEAAIVDSTYFYWLLFVAHDPFSPDWKNFEAVDHPPLSKYLYGAALALDGTTIDSIEPKRHWVETTWEADDDRRFLGELHAQLPPRLLRAPRALSAGFLFGATMLLYWIAAEVSSPWIGLLAVVLFRIHPVIRWTSARVMIDGLLALGILAVLALQLRWARRASPDTRLAIGPPLLLGAALGLLFSIKISGVVGLLAALLSLWLWPRRLRLPAAGVVVGAALIVALVINPSVCSDPAGFVAEMFHHRARVLDAQQVLFGDSALLTAHQTVAAFLERLFLKIDPVFRIIRLPVILPACAVGAIRFFQLLRGRPLALGIVAIHGGLWTLAAAFSYRMNWPRYVMPAVPFLALLVALGMAEIATRLSHLSKRERSFALASAALIWALAASMPVISPEDSAARRMELAQRVLRDLPDSPGLEAALLRWIDRSRVDARPTSHPTSQP
jgi:hypothetical protein